MNIVIIKVTVQSDLLLIKKNRQLLAVFLWKKLGMKRTESPPISKSMLKIKDMSHIEIMNNSDILKNWYQDIAAFLR